MQKSLSNLAKNQQSSFNKLLISKLFHINKTFYHTNVPLKFARKDFYRINYYILLS